MTVAVSDPQAAQASGFVVLSVVEVARKTVETRLPTTEMV